MSNLLTQLAEIKALHEEAYELKKQSEQAHKVWKTKDRASKEKRNARDLALQKLAIERPVLFADFAKEIISFDYPGLDCKIAKGIVHTDIKLNNLSEEEQQTLEPIMHQPQAFISIKTEGEEMQKLYKFLVKKMKNVIESEPGFNLTLPFAASVEDNSCFSPIYKILLPFKQKQPYFDYNEMLKNSTFEIRVINGDAYIVALTVKNIAKFMVHIPNNYINGRQKVNIDMGAREVQKALCTIYEKYAENENADNK